MEEPEPGLTIPEFVKWVNARVPAAGVGVWWLTPDPAFEGRTPMQVVEAGERELLVATAFVLSAGTPT